MKNTNIITAYIHRHGRSIFNNDYDKDGEIVIGNYESPLTEYGQAQAKLLGLQFKERGIEFDYLVSSNLSRALDTAKLARSSMNSNLEVSINKEFHEIDIGDFTLKSLKQVKRELGNENFSKFLFEESDYKFKGAIESNKEAGRRFLNALKGELKSGAKNGAKNVLIASHSAVIKLFMREIGYCSEESLSNVEGFKIEYDSGADKIISYNRIKVDQSAIANKEKITSEERHILFPKLLREMRQQLTKERGIEYRDDE